MIRWAWGWPPFSHWLQCSARWGGVLIRLHHMITLDEKRWTHGRIQIRALEIRWRQVILYWLGFVGMSIWWNRWDKTFPESPMSPYWTSGCWFVWFTENTHNIMKYIAILLNYNQTLMIIDQVCMIFVFVSILEFIVVTVYLRSGRKSLGDKVNIYF